MVRRWAWRRVAYVWFIARHSSLWTLVVIALVAVVLVTCSIGATGAPRPAPPVTAPAPPGQTPGQTPGATARPSSPQAELNDIYAAYANVTGDTISYAYARTIFEQRFSYRQVVGGAAFTGRLPPEYALPAPSPAPIDPSDPYAKALTLFRAGFPVEALTEAKVVLAANVASSLPPELRAVVIPDPNDPFKVALAELDAGLPDDALKESVAQLAAHPERTLPPRLQERISSRSTDPFNLALMYARAGLDDPARRETARQMTAHPELAIPPELRRFVDAVGPDPFNVARAYARAGFDDKAREATLTELGRHPDRTIPPELAYLTNRAGEVFVDRELDPARAWSSIENPRTWIEVVARDVAAGLVALLVFTVVIWPLLVRAIVPRYRIADFESAPPDVGKGVARLIENELRWLAAEGGGSALGWAAGPDAPVSLPDALKGLPPAFGWLAGLLSSFPSNTYVVSGTLQGRGANGVGMSLRLADPSGQVRKGVTIWENFIDPRYAAPAKDAPDAAGTEAYQMLGRAGAARLREQLPT